MLAHRYRAEHRRVLSKITPKPNLEIPRLKLGPQSTRVYGPKPWVRQWIRATRGRAELPIPGVYPLQELLDCAGGPREEGVVRLCRADNSPEVDFRDDDAEVADDLGVLKAVRYMSPSEHEDHDDAYRWEAIVCQLCRPCQTRVAMKVDLRSLTLHSKLVPVEHTN